MTHVPGELVSLPQHVRPLAQSDCAMQLSVLVVGMQTPGAGFVQA
jgi:hypothetical protein